MWKIICVFLVVYLVTDTEAEQGAFCLRDCQCDCGECCEMPNPNPVVSKRLLSLVPVPIGSCQPYTRRGEPCNPFDDINGYCSCEPGTKCTHHPPPIEPIEAELSLASPAKRLLAPGTYTCDPV